MTAFFASLATCFVFFPCLTRNSFLSLFSLLLKELTSLLVPSLSFPRIESGLSTTIDFDCFFPCFLQSVHAILPTSFCLRFLRFKCRQYQFHSWASGTALNYLKGWNTRKEIITTTKTLSLRSRCNCRFRWLNSLLTIISEMEFKTRTVYPPGVAIWKD